MPYLNHGSQELLSLVEGMYGYICQGNAEAFTLGRELLYPTTRLSGKRFCRRDYANVPGPNDRICRCRECTLAVKQDGKDDLRCGSTTVRLLARQVAGKVKISRTKV